MDNNDDFEELLKDEMDFETFRDTVIALIWRDDMQGLRQVSQKQVMLSLFLEKVIGEIAAGNSWNDVLYLMARRLIEADPGMDFYREALKSKKQFVHNPTGGREILQPFVHEELSADEFMEQIELIAGTHTYMGLNAIVAENPNNTRAFIRQFVEMHGNSFETDTRLFQLLCEMAAAYRNHHHKSDLLQMLEEVGGTLNLFRSEEDIGTIRTFTGEDTLSELEAVARQARKTLFNGDNRGALESYEELIPKMDVIYKDSIPTGGSEYENALLFSGVLLSLKGEEVKAQEQFMKCMQKRYHYGELLLMNTGSLRQNAAIVSAAFRKLPADTPSHLSFDQFFELASGHSYSEVNHLFNQFVILAGDREMEEAFELSERLLRLYAEKRNPIIENSLSEYLVHIFRTCHLLLQGDEVAAQREYFEGARGEATPDVLRRNLKGIKSDPEKTLALYFGD